MASAVEEVQEGAKKPYIPFLGRVELTLGSVTALLVGAILWFMIQTSGENLAEDVGAWLGGLIGYNPAQGQTASNEPAFGGA